MNFKSIGIPTIKLLVIAAVITILLFLTNNTTEAKIAQNQADANVASRKEVLPDADDFDEKTVTVDGVEYTYYEAKNGAGYVFSGSNKGYGGAVVSMVGISSDGKVVGVKVTEASDETPGLGAKWIAADASGNERRAQFVGGKRQRTVWPKRWWKSPNIARQGAEAASGCRIWCRGAFWRSPRWTPCWTENIT